MRPLVLGVLLAEATRASVGKCQGNSGSQDIIETVSAQENKKKGFSEIKSKHKRVVYSSSRNGSGPEVKKSDVATMVRPQDKLSSS